MQATTGTALTDGSGTQPTRPGVDRRLLALVATVSALTWVADQATKWWAQRSLAVGVPRDLVDGLLRLDLTHNPGAAFGTATGYTAFLTLIAIGVVVGCLRVASRLGSRWWAVALGLLLGGALGNLTDRFARAPGPLRGQVVDFLELPHWPVFNLADTAITSAAVLIVLLSILGIRFDGSRHGRT